MILYLTSSPFVDGADRAILSPANSLLTRLKADLPENPRCLFICSDPERRDLTARFGADVFMAFAEAGIDFSAYAVLDGHNADRAAELIFSSDFIVLAGGHVPTQNDFFREIRLDVLLQEFQGVILGISAGSMNCARWVYAQPEEPGETLDPDYQRFVPGLGLTDINICPHYQKVKNYIIDGQRLFEDVTYYDSFGHTFYALPDGSYFYITDEEILLLGEAYRIREGVLEQITLDGDMLLI